MFCSCCEFLLFPAVESLIKLVVGLHNSTTGVSYILKDNRIKETPKKSR